jgi:alkylation response protein AidB-like acyl-CoA dehydrogenase
VTHAEHAIEVIDHRTRKQVAEWVGQIDPDLVALQMLLAALYFNRAWVAVEVTGGYGLSIARKLAMDWRYARTYTEQSGTSGWRHGGPDRAGHGRGVEAADGG